MVEASELEELRAQASRELAESEEALAQAEAATSVVELDQARTGRLSRMDAMQQQALGSGMVERLRTRRRRLIAALERLDLGEFGICCACRESIPVERLRADTGTPFCAACQEEIDERHR